MQLKPVLPYSKWVVVVFLGVSLFLIAGALRQGEPLLLIIGLVGIFITSSKSVYELEEDGVRVKYRFFGLIGGSSFYPFSELRIVRKYPYGKDGFVVLELWWTGFRGKKFILTQKDGNALYKKLSAYADKKGWFVVKNGK